MMNDASDPWTPLHDLILDSLWASPRTSFQGLLCGSLGNSIWDSLWLFFLGGLWNSLGNSLGGSLHGSLWESQR